MQHHANITAESLAGVVVAHTATSRVDGEKGELVIAGAPVGELAGRFRFEAVCARLWQVSEVDFFAGREIGYHRAIGLWPHMRHLQAIDFARAVAASLHESGLTPAHIVGIFGAAVAAWTALVAERTPLLPERDHHHSADLLHIAGKASGPGAAADALDAYLVTVCDHGLNASTFAARVTASTGADDLSAVIAGVSALKGPLHGGAPGPVLDMIATIGKPEAAREWIATELASGRRIMGMGHRIYRVRDPRAEVLERAISRLQAHEFATSKLALARVVEKEATTQLAAKHPDRPLCANVEFYTAVLLDALGLPSESFSAWFAASRVAGWLAHAREQRLVGRLIRPDSVYVGA